MVQPNVRPAESVGGFCRNRIVGRAERRQPLEQTVAHWIVIMKQPSPPKRRSFMTAVTHGLLLPLLLLLVADSVGGCGGVRKSRWDHGWLLVVVVASRIRAKCINIVTAAVEGQRLPQLTPAIDALHS